MQSRLNRAVLAFAILAALGASLFKLAIDDHLDAVLKPTRFPPQDLIVLAAHSVPPLTLSSPQALDGNKKRRRSKKKLGTSASQSLVYVHTSSNLLDFYSLTINAECRLPNSKEPVPLWARIISKAAPHRGYWTLLLQTVKEEQEEAVLDCIARIFGVPILNPHDSTKMHQFQDVRSAAYFADPATTFFLPSEGFALNADDTVKFFEWRVDGDQQAEHAFHRSMSKLRAGAKAQATAPNVNPKSLQTRARRHFLFDMSTAAFRSRKDLWISTRWQVTIASGSLLSGGQDPFCQHLHPPLQIEHSNDGKILLDSEDTVRASLCLAARHGKDWDTLTGILYNVDNDANTVSFSALETSVNGEGKHDIRTVITKYWSHFDQQGAGEIDAEGASFDGQGDGEIAAEGESFGKPSSGGEWHEGEGSDSADGNSLASWHQTQNVFSTHVLTCVRKAPDTLFSP